MTKESRIALVDTIIGSERQEGDENDSAEDTIPRILETNEKVVVVATEVHDDSEERKVAEFLVQVSETTTSRRDEPQPTKSSDVPEPPSVPRIRTRRQLHLQQNQQQPCQPDNNEKDVLIGVILEGNQQNKSEKEGQVSGNSKFDQAVQEQVQRHTKKRSNSNDEVLRLVSESSSRRIQSAQPESAASAESLVTTPPRMMTRRQQQQHEQEQERQRNQQQEQQQINRLERQQNHSIVTPSTTQKETNNTDANPLFIHFRTLDKKFKYNNSRNWSTRKCICLYCEEYYKENPDGKYPELVIKKSRSCRTHLKNCIHYDNHLKRTGETSIILMTSLGEYKSNNSRNKKRRHSVQSKDSTASTESIESENKKQQSSHQKITRRPIVTNNKSNNNMRNGDNVGEDMQDYENNNEKQSDDMTDPRSIFESIMALAGVDDEVNQLAIVRLQEILDELSVKVKAKKRKYEEALMNLMMKKKLCKDNNNNNDNNTINNKNIHSTKKNSRTIERDQV